MNIWELVEYVGETLVFIGVAGEVIAEWREPHRSKLGKASSLVLIAGLALSLAALIATNEYFNGTIASLNLKSSQTSERAAKLEADNLKLRLELTQQEQRTAEAEKGVASAKKQAAKAEHDLADALTQVAALTKELNRLKTPRTLTNAANLISALREFNGPTYTFLGVYVDKDSMDLAKQINGILSAAGWKRVKPPNSSAIILTISNDFTVAVSAESGVLVQVEASNPGSLATMPSSSWPSQVRAAQALKSGLAAGLNPPQDDLNIPLGVSPGNHTDVFITIGKKP